MNECELCRQEPYLSEQRPCPWHEPEVIEEHIRQWAEYDRRKAADPDYMTEDTNPGPRYEGCA